MVFADHWHPSYEGAPIDGSVWDTEGDDRYRVLRGGSWYTILGTVVPLTALPEHARESRQYHWFSGRLCFSLDSVALYTFALLPSTLFSFPFFSLPCAKPPPKSPNSGGLSTHSRLKVPQNWGI